MGAHAWVRMELLVDNSKQSEFCASLTSFDWNEVRPCVGSF
jgi:hypothetical protein